MTGHYSIHNHSDEAGGCGECVWGVLGVRGFYTQLTTPSNDRHPRKMTDSETESFILSDTEPDGVFEDKPAPDLEETAQEAENFNGSDGDESCSSSSSGGSSILTIHVIN